MAGDAVTVSSFAPSSALLQQSLTFPPADGLGHLLVIVCCSFMSLVPKELPSGS